MAYVKRFFFVNFALCNTFLSEVEDGWWKGKLRGRVGVFPSNFVEMVKTGASSNTNTASTEDEVADKNKRNEKLKGK